MEDSLIVIFSMILAVILMFVFPIMDTWERQDDISYMSVYATVVEFVDSVRNLGRITPDMYEQFIQGLNATGNRFEITLEHRKRLYGEDSSGQPISAYKNVYTSTIEGILNDTSTPGNITDNYYNLAAGDYFYVSVKNTNKTQSTLIKEVLYASMQETFKIGVPYGGMVRNTGK